jgi:alkylation response protein AidB-like acyl-CoA dehydrogenase
MDFELDEMDLMIQKTTGDFAMQVLAPRAYLADDDEDFCQDSIELLRKNDYLGILVPEEYGGAGMSTFQYVLVKEQLGRGCHSTAAILGAQNLAVSPLLLAANEAQKQRYLPRLATGELIGAFGLTEANTGSDVAGISTHATRDGDEYILNGSKQFVTNGGVASLVVVFAKTNPALGHKGITAFIVEKGTPGFSIGKHENKMGIRGTSTAQLIFTECRVPAANRLGAEGEGFKLAMMVLDRARPAVAAQALGIAQAAMDLAIEYATGRSVFGKPISEYQHTRFVIADMATRLDAARLLVYRAARLATLGKGRFTKEAAMAKLYASETAHWIVDRSLQIHGGYGYMKEYTIERLYRDQRILEIYEGTSEIQRIIISNHMLS